MLLDRILVVIAFLTLLFTMTTSNMGFFSGAKDFTVAGGNFMDIHGDHVCFSLVMFLGLFYHPSQIVNYMGSMSTDQMEPLPPTKHSSAFFTGRDSYFKILEDYFGSHSGIWRKSYLLYGMGGIG